MEQGFIFFYILGIAIVLVGSIAAYMLCARFNAMPGRWFKIILAAFSGAALYMPAAQILKYYSLHMYADISHWLQVLYQLGNSGLPLSPNVAFANPAFGNYLAAHFVPFIYLFALPFKVLPYAETVIVLNSLFMFSAVIPLYKLALHISKNRTFARVVSVLFLWYPTFQYITLYEFEMLRFSIPVLLWMLYFFERRRIRWYWISVLTATLVREEVGLTIFMFGIYVWFARHERRLGMLTSVLGLAMFVLITGVVMPSFHTSPTVVSVAGAGSFQEWGRTLPEAVLNMVSNPVRLASAIFTVDKFANVFMLLLPLLLLPLAAPTALLGALPSVGIGLVSLWPLHSSYMLYYVAPAVPFIFYAFIKAWPKVVRRLPSPPPQSPPIKGGAGVDTSSSLVGEVRRGWNETALMCAVLAGMLVSNIWFGPSPISLQFWFKDLRPAPFRTQNFHWSAYRVSDHHRKAQEFVDRIPGDVIVSAQEFFQPRLFKKKGAMVFPRLVSKDGSVQADYVLLDITHNGLPPTSPVRFEVTKETLTGVMDNPKEWELISTDGEFFIYKRIGQS